MTRIPSFERQQRQFLQYLRRPDSAPLPSGFAPERTAVYVDLLYNKFDESLTTCFPVINGLLSKEAWRALLLDFIAEHRCRTPYYRRIPDEFVQYLQDVRHRSEDWPFLAELAHFEWIELQLSITEAEPVVFKTLTKAKLLTNAPVFAPVLQLLHYRWPVQDINPAFLPMEAHATTTHILGFRDRDDQVQFMALSPMTAHLVILLGNGFNGQRALETLGAGLDEAAYHTFLQFGLDVMIDLHRRGAIVDARPADFSGDDE
ncbi:MAG: HvfC family RiPP maturation protein [Gammaproteobacteria bacterium]